MHTSYVRTAWERCQRPTLDLMDDGGRRTRPSLLRRSCEALRSALAFLFSHAGVCALVLAYTLFGAALFLRVEGGAATDAAAAAIQRASRRRRMTAESLWALTDKYNILEEGRWRAGVDARIRYHQEALVADVRRDAAAEWALGAEGAAAGRPQWTFAAALMYALTVYTTIGYGHLTPRTVWGKVATMAYALAGIPLMLLYMASVGDILASAFRYVYFNFLCRVKRRGRRRGEEGESEGRKEKQIPVWACLSVIAGFVAGGATLFSAWEGWPLLDAAYFCVVSLVTVGFGDLVPGDAFGGADTSNLTMARQEAVEGHALPSIYSRRLQSDGFYVGRLAGDEEDVPTAPMTWPRTTPAPGAAFVFSDYVTTADMMMVDGKLIFCALYLLTGMALLAMNFHLMQETGLRAARRILERLKPSWGQSKGQKRAVRRWERKGWRRSTWAGEGRRWREEKEKSVAAPVVITLESEEGAVYDWEPGGAASEVDASSVCREESRGEWRERRASDGTLPTLRLEVPSLSRTPSGGSSAPRSPRGSLCVEGAGGRRVRRVGARKRGLGRVAAWRRKRRQLRRHGFQNPFFSSTEHIPTHSFP